MKDKINWKPVNDTKNLMAYPAGGQLASTAGTLTTANQFEKLSSLHWWKVHGKIS